MTRLLLFVVIAAVSLFPSHHAAVINHDAVPVWPEPIPKPGSAEEIAVKFKPQLIVYNGCQPYPVVDADGNTSGGLKPRGPSSSGCRDHSKAQIYSRSAWYKDTYGIMYVWYFPKDQLTDFGGGHRHDWESAVVWLDNNKTDAHIVAASVTTSGRFQIKSPVKKDCIQNDVSLRVAYGHLWPYRHHAQFTTLDGTFQPLIQWEQMTNAAKKALSTASFSKDVLLIDDNFQNKLAQAYFKKTKS